MPIPDDITPIQVNECGEANIVTKLSLLAEELLQFASFLTGLKISIDPQSEHLTALLKIARDELTRRGMLKTLPDGTTNASMQMN